MLTKEFTIKILRYTGVVTLPGSPAFPLKAGEGYLCVSYVLPIETIRKGLEKFMEGVERIKSI